MKDILFDKGRLLLVILWNKVKWCVIEVWARPKTVYSVQVSLLIGTTLTCFIKS